MKWRGPAAAIAAGVAAAVQLGQVAPVSGAISRDLHLSPAAVGMAISLVTLVTTIAAAPTAWFVRRSSASESRLVAAGLVVLAAVNVLTAVVAHSATIFLLLRAAGGAGYLLVVVLGPVLLVEQVGRQHSSWALALWGSCIPAGIALAAVAGGACGALFGWRGWFIVVAVATGMIAGTVVIPTSSPASSAAAATTRMRVLSEWRHPLYLAAAFCLVASIAVVVTSLLPSYLHSARGLSQVAGGSVTSLVAIASVPGSVAAGVLLRRGVRPLVAGLAVLGCPIAAAVGFAATPLAISVGAIILLVFLSGLGVSAVYGALPSVVNSPEELSLANGILVQLGSVGTLLAPPIFATVTGLSHWVLMPVLLAVPALGGLALLAVAVTRPP